MSKVTFFFRSEGAAASRTFEWSSVPRIGDMVDLGDFSGRVSDVTWMADGTVFIELHDAATEPIRAVMD